MFRKTLSLVLVFGMVTSPVPTLAGPQIRGIKGDIPAPVSIPADTLPVPTNVNLRGVSSFTVDEAANKLTVHQDQAKAVINWKSFDIGENAWTHFDQQGHKDWAALNRIHDLNPSRILGKLTADGKIYLINQNGILFGPKSQVTVQSLTATTLNTLDDDFLAGLNRFKAQDYLGAGAQAASNPAVVNEGKISVDQLGAVFLMGQSVTNSGSIDAPVGQIGLAAGSQVDLLTDSSGNRAAKMVKVTGDLGQAVNTETGSLTSDTGLVGMYGREVHQDGQIRATTAIKKRGEIELFATDLIRTGAGSVTATPVSESTETAHESFVYQAGNIWLSGLDPSSPGFPHTAVGRIEHHGALVAPSGTITLDAAERVFLDAGSLIDVSGLWLRKPASARLVEAQLNSVNLKDDYGQKDGILKGKTVKMEMHKGTAIGDISGSLQSRELTAMDRSIEGGSIFVTASSGDIVMKPGSTMAFAGGGIRYDAGSIGTTTLISGRKFYDIASAPQWLTYDGFLDSNTVLHRRFGVKETFTGIYTGGAVPLMNRLDALVQGADAGSAQLMARHLYLDGTLNGTVTRGFFQTLAADPRDEFGYQTALGWREPQGGTLIIGDPPAAASPELIDFVTHAVRIAKDPTPASLSLGPDAPLHDAANPQESVLSAAILNEAGLGRLSIYANTTLTMDQDATLSLIPGGSFTGTARRIEQNGSIFAAGGSITLSTQDNVTALKTVFGNPNDRYVPLDSLVFLGPGAVLDATGQRIDNRLTGKAQKPSQGFAHISGGSVSLQDNTGLGLGVFLTPGSLVDVSGGYGIDESGKLTKGNAGSLQLMGPSLAVEATLKGHSILGAQGGTFIAHANNVQVSASAPSLPDGFSADSPIPSEMLGRFTLAQDFFKDTGITQLDLRSVNDLVIDSGVTLTPSSMKFAEPVSGTAMALPWVPGSGQARKAGPPPVPDLVSASPEFLGKTAFKASAGVIRPVSGGGQIPNDQARLVLSQGARVEMAPGGQIGLEGPAVDVSGRLSAPSGKISLKATVHDLRVRENSVIDAAGCNRPDAKPLNRNAPLGYTPLAGGEISLLAANGSLLLEAGSLLDVSGSAPVSVVTRKADGMPLVTTMASDPGKISLTFLDTLVLDGELSGRGALPGLRGGTLSITRRDSLRALQVDAGQLERYATDGFDALTFASLSTVELTGSIGSGLKPFEIARSLTFDAPRIQGTDGDVHLASPWITLTNTSWPDAGGAAAGTGTLHLSGAWIDVTGSVTLSGFQDVTLEAARDLRLSDRYYTREGSNPLWKGNLTASGRLTLDADRIYPTTLSQFRIEAAESITTLPGATDATRPIYSAGGSLTLAAPLIHHQGFLAAPMGSLSLLGTGSQGRVVLEDGSVLTTAGNAAVNYGTLDNGFWSIPDKKTLLSAEVVGAPAKSIDVQAGEIIAREGSLVDASGGGGVFAYQFLPGIDGSVNPLTRSGRYVILPDNPMALPGETVYLTGSSLVPEGVYTLLPAEFAFAPGAVVITDLGTKMAAGETGLTAEGYTLASGYTTVAGSDLRPGIMKGFSLRRAEDVLKEGNFTLATIEAGDGGSMSLRASTTLFSGAFRAEGLNGFDGGSLTLSARNIFVQEEGVPLPPDFKFDTPVPTDLVGKLFVSGSSLSGGGLGQLVLGDAATETITLSRGSSLESERVSLVASKEVLLETGARILALADKGRGEAVITAPKGLLTLEEGALIHASDAISLDVSRFDLRGDLLTDHSTLNLGGERILFVEEGAARTEPGLYLTEALWGKLRSFETVSLKSASEIVFAGDFNLSVENLLTLDAARIAGQDPLGDGKAMVQLSAGQVELRNTTGKTSAVASLADSGSFDVRAQSIVLGGGEVLLDGFGTASLTSVGDLTLKGRGALITGGDLDLTAARVTTSFARSDTTPYTAADYRLDALAGKLSLHPSGGTGGTSVTPGGSLTLNARAVDVAGVIDLRSGRLALNASGTAADGGIVLRSGSEIRAMGSDFGPGSTVSLSAASGPVRIETGSLIDVSAGRQGDSGAIAIASPGSGVLLDGRLLAHAAEGAGGSFSLDTASLADLSALSTQLAAGGFFNALEMRVRSGDVLLGADDAVRARIFALAVDSGRLDVHGRIDVSGSGGGGTVSLVAGGDLTLHGGSVLNASGTGAGADGGWVTLGSASGLLRTMQGSTVDVSGSGTGAGGTVHLRAQRTTDDVHLDLDGSILGPDRILAEAFRVTSYTGAKTLTASDLTALQGETAGFMSHAAAIESRLLAGLDRNGWSDATLHLLPGIELRSTGDLTLGSTWDLTTWRFGDEPGVLTLRAAGRLNLKSDLVDHPTALGVPSDLSDPGLFSGTAKASWAFNLSAGADLNAANPLAVGTGAWDLTLDSGRQVYSESGPIRFASARDTVLGPSSATVYMNYGNIGSSLGSYAGSIHASVGRDLKISGGAIQTAVGDIDLTVGRDLVFEVGGGTTGAIRTLGESPNGKVSNDPLDPRTSGVSQYWFYTGGGDIDVTVAGSIQGVLVQSPDASKQGWDQAYGVRPPRKWAASYQGRDATQGIAAMGGGNVFIRTGGNFRGQAGTFGEGDFVLYAGGDVQGRFLVRDGEGTIQAMGSFGGGRVASVMEAFDARILVGSQGNLDMGAIVNPTIARSLFAGGEWELRYSEDASIRLVSATGDVSLYGDSPFYGLIPSAARLERVLPGTLQIEAGGNIRILNEFALAPSSTGSLTLRALGNIDGTYIGPEGKPVRGLIAMSDMDPEQVYGYHRGFRVADIFSPYSHGSTVLHQEDLNPSLLQAGGDLCNLQLYMAESVVLSAGRDVRDVYLFGQNVRTDDVTAVLAGRNILFSSSIQDNQFTGIELAGPGALLVQAKNSIDLGTSKGIRSVGNTYHPPLGEDGASIVVGAGFEGTLDPGAVRGFFAALKEAGKDYSTLLAEGETGKAQEVIETVRGEVIEPFLTVSDPSSPGRINMTSSQISTTSGISDIFVLAAGDLNVGRSTFFSDEQQRQGTGIYTASGGAVSIFSFGDINVNESRVMTFRGGDIMLWSDRGDINAGRGSKTAVSATPPKLTRIGDLWVLVFNPPALGSGVRAVTFDPDGIEGPQVEPPAGDVYLFAPQGIIDAGEAGIAGTNVFLGATQVLNVENISFTAGSVGVPATGEGVASLGALTGAATATEGVRDVQQATAVASARNAGALDQSATEAFLSKWLEVKVVRFDVEEEDMAREES